MDNSFRSVIDQSKSILILIPTKPFFDQVAAGMALYLCLRQDKDVQIFSPSPTTVEFNRIIGVNKITQELGNKNLIIRFTDYKADDIERVSYDIENSQFRLTVIPRQRISPPGKDQIELSYSGVSADTIIMVGGANESHFPAITSRELTSANIVHVGIKDLSLSSNKSYLSFSRPASSVSEVVASLIKESGMVIDEDIATNLLMGIENASNNLSDPTVTAETFSVVAGLMKLGARRAVLQPIANKEEFPQGAIPGRYTSQQNTSQTPVQSLTQDQVKADRPLQQFSKQEKNLSDQDDPSQSNDMEKAPNDWLQPKIYKGTSIS